MPQFHIQGDAEAFENAEAFEVAGEMQPYGFVTAERVDDVTVLITEVHPRYLQSFEGPLFQVTIEPAEEGEEDGEEEESIVLRQVQMFFWPWDGEEEDEEDATDGEDDTLA